MKILASLILCLAAAPAVAQTTAYTGETMLPVVEQAFAVNGCSFPMQDGEALMAQSIATILETDVATVTNRETGHWHAVNDAMDTLIDSGRFQPDMSAGVFRLADCTPA